MREKVSADGLGWVGKLMELADSMREKVLTDYFGWTKERGSIRRWCT